MTDKNTLWQWAASALPGLGDVLLRLDGRLRGVPPSAVGIMGDHGPMGALTVDNRIFTMALLDDTGWTRLAIDVPRALRLKKNISRGECLRVVRVGRGPLWSIEAGDLASAALDKGDESFCCHSCYYMDRVTGAFLRELTRGVWTFHDFLHVAGVVLQGDLDEAASLLVRLLDLRWLVPEGPPVGSDFSGLTKAHTLRTTPAFRADLRTLKTTTQTHLEPHQ